MLREDKQESEQSTKLQAELEASILAISEKFKAFDVEITIPLDNAMDSMDIDPEICMYTYLLSATHAYTRTTAYEGLAFLGRQQDLRIPFWETCTICG
jgi:hypothetical protein